MNSFGLAFHHLGLAVRKPQSALTFVRGLGYSAGPQVFDAEQNVNLILCVHATQPAIEIISPGGSVGPVDRLVGRYMNGIVYHPCFHSRDIGASLTSLGDAGLRPVCIVPPKPAALFGGARVAFYDVPGIGLVELIEEASSGA